MANAEASAPEVVQRFWGMKLAPGKPFTLTLTRTELHVTQATLVEGGAAGSGAVTLYASTPTIRDVPIVTLTRGAGAPTSTLLDVNFFPEDESVTFRLEGAASVALAGSIAIFGGILVVSDSEDEEEESAGKAKAGSKRPAAAVDPRASKQAKKAAEEEEEDEDEEDEDEDEDEEDDEDE
jgi:FK506-binding nuclear protein